MPDPLDILAFAAAASIGMILAWYGIGVLARLWCDARLRREIIGKGRLMLTFDDGPGPSTTPALLDLLREYDAKATFFLIGDSVERAPDVVERMAAEGHAIGWHSQTHRNQWKSGPLRALADVWSPRGLLARDTTRPTVFRPPFGKMTLGTVIAARTRRLPIVMWTHVSGDTHETLPDPTAVVEKIDRDRGCVVLMHDMDRDDPSRSDFVLEVTRRLLELGRQRKWDIVTPRNHQGRP